MEEGNRNKSSSEHVDGDHRSQTGRFYGCSFCKMGFTSAQALGGHMNIHRKDKAKLRQAEVNAGESSGQKVEGSGRSREHGYRVRSGEDDDLDLELRLGYDR